MSSALKARHDRWLALADSPRGAWVAFAVAVALKLLFLLLLADKPPNVDGILYLSAAEEMMNSGVEAAREIYRMPAYPLLVGLVHAVVPDWIWSARLIALASLLGTTWILYRLTAAMFDRRAAFWATLAFAIVPMPNEMTVLVYRGPVYLLVFAMAVWWMSRCFEQPRPWVILGAILCGALAPLFRIEGVFLVPFFIVALLGYAMVEARARPAVLKGLGAALVLLLVLGGIFLWLGGVERLGATRFDEVFIQLKGLGYRIHENYARIRDGLIAMEAASSIPSQGENFGEIALNFVLPIYALGFLALVVKTLTPSLALPMLAGFRGRWNVTTRWVVAVIAAYGLMLFLALIANDYSGSRFVFAPTYLLYPFVGAGAAWCIAWIHRRHRSVRWWVVFYLLMVALPLKATLGTLEADDLSAVRAGRWLAASPWRNEAIIGNDPRIAFAAHIPLYGDNTQYLHYRPENRDYGKIEAMAINAHRPLIFLKLRKKRLERLPEMTQYRQIKRFEDDEKIVFVFASPEIDVQDGPNAE